MSQIGIGTVSLFIFGASVTAYRAGYNPAKFYLIAWSVLAVGIGVYALKDAAVIPSNPFTNYLLLFGSAVEAILLSLALANGIAILKKEKEDSQARELVASKENERIVKEQNLLLEVKVGERTSDLEETNNELSNTLNQLRDTQSQLVDAEKMASLGQLTAGVAHEINNPINFVSANIQPLRFDIEDIKSVFALYESVGSGEEFDQKKPEIEVLKKKLDIDYVMVEVTQLIDAIEDGASRTTEIVKGLKNFSRLDEENLKATDLNEGLESTLIILSSNVPEGMEIITDLGVIPKVECLGGKINQVFMNIINNSLQAVSENGTGYGHKLIIKSWEENKQAYFSFIDDGPGIPKEIQKKIFEPFFTTKEVGGGTGLGLSISFSIIDSHQGKIHVESEVGQGAKFIINLPITSPL